MDAWLDETLKAVHVLAVVFWVGGMVFAHFVLRPSLEASGLEGPQRLRLMREVLRRFLRAVAVAVALVLVSGAWMVERAVSMVDATGGRFTMPWSWQVMTALGLAMTAVYVWVRLRWFAAMERALDAGQPPAAAAALAQVRRWVGVNIVLGLVVVAVAVAF